MFSKLRLLPLTLIAVLALVLAACGGDGGNDVGGDGADDSPPQRQTDGPDDTADDGDVAADIDTDDELFVSNGVEVLTQSAESFASEEITSMRGDVSFNFAMGATALSGNAVFKFQSPGQAHMTMAFEGGDQQSLVDLSQFGTLEMLVRDETFYMNIPFLGGWFYMTPEDLGAGAADVQDMLAQGSAFDYDSFLGDLPEGVEYVGEEDVDGRATAHYRFTGDLQGLIGSFADALAASGDNAFADQILGSPLNGPVSVNIWVGKDDLLPYKMDATANIETPDGPLTLGLTGNFGGYNEDIAIPDAPADATSFADVFAELGLDPSAISGQ